MPLLKFIFVLLLAAISLPGLTQTRYIRKFRPLADSLSGQYGIPSAVMLGVAIIESGSGSSRNAKLLNNHFGIKGKNKLKEKRSEYKQYETPADSYIDFCKLLKKKKYYKDLKGNEDYLVWLDAMSKHGYSEIPEIWKKRISSAIRQYKLGTTKKKT